MTHHRGLDILDLCKIIRIGIGALFVESGIDDRLVELCLQIGQRRVLGRGDGDNDIAVHIRLANPNPDGKWIGACLMLEAELGDIHDGRHAAFSLERAVQIGNDVGQRRILCHRHRDHAVVHSSHRVGIVGSGMFEHKVDPVPVSPMAAGIAEAVGGDICRIGFPGNFGRLHVGLDILEPPEHICMKIGFHRLAGHLHPKGWCWLSFIVKIDRASRDMGQGLRLGRRTLARGLLLFAQMELVIVIAVGAFALSLGGQLIFMVTRQQTARGNAVIRAVQILRRVPFQRRILYIPFLQVRVGEVRRHHTISINGGDDKDGVAARNQVIKIEPVCLHGSHFNGVPIGATEHEHRMRHIFAGTDNTIIAGTGHQGNVQHSLGKVERRVPQIDGAGLDGDTLAQRHHRNGTALQRSVEGAERGVQIIGITCCRIRTGQGDCDSAVR